jgi:hypothetical protein
MAAQEPSLVGRRGLGPWDMRQRVVAHPAPCLILKPICRGTRSAGYRQKNDIKVYAYYQL